MSTNPAVIETASPAGLSEIERVVNTFVAPSKTFKDILRSASWWMPFLLIVILTVAQAWVVDTKVGYDTVTANQMKSNPKAEDRLNQLPPEQKAKQMEMSAKITRVISYVAPVRLVIFFALYALILWAAFNFGFGAQTTFWQAFAVTW